MTPEGFKRRRHLRLPARLVTVSWRDLLVIVVPVLLVTALAAWLAVKFIRPAPPDTIVMLAGPKESSYYNIAERYAKIIARSGVKVQIVETDGAQDNLQRLADHKVARRCGFRAGRHDGRRRDRRPDVPGQRIRPAGSGLLSQQGTGGTAHRNWKASASPSARKAAARTCWP